MAGGELPFWPFTAVAQQQVTGGVAEGPSDSSTIIEWLLSAPAQQEQRQEQERVTNPALAVPLASASTTGGPFAFRSTTPLFAPSPNPLAATIQGFPMADDAGAAESPAHRGLGGVAPRIRRRSGPRVAARGGRTASRKRRAHEDDSLQLSDTAEDSSSVGASGIEQMSLHERKTKRSRISAPQARDGEVMGFDLPPDASDNEGCPTSPLGQIAPPCPRSETPDFPSSSQGSEVMLDGEGESLAVEVGESSSSEESDFDNDGQMQDLTQTAIDWNRVNELLAGTPPDIDPLMIEASVNQLLSLLEAQAQAHGGTAVPVSLKTGYRGLFDEFSIQTWRTCQRRGQILTRTAIQVWAALFRPSCVWIDHWFAFLVLEDVTHITRDSWDLFLDFVTEFGSNAGFDELYDSSAAWPVTFDDFAQWHRARR